MPTALNQESLNQSDDFLSFIDHFVLSIVQIEDVYQLNEFLGTMLSDDVVDFIHQHKDTLCVLSESLNEKIRETVFESDDLMLPDGLLMIPPLYESLGWKTKPTTWNEASEKYRQLFEDETSLPYALSMLFLNAMQSDMHNALKEFRNSIERLSEDDQIHADRYLQNLRYFGWQENELENASS